MASVHDYKRFENKLVLKVKNAAISVVYAIAGILKGIGRFLTRRYTVVFVPHSEKRVYNFHITVLSIFCFFMVISAIIGAFLYYGASYSNTMYTMSNKDSRIKDIEASLDQLRDETALLIKEAQKFEAALTASLPSLGADLNKPHNAAGDLTSFLNIRETSDGLLQEVDDVRRLTAFLSRAADPVKELGTLLDSHNALLTDIPSVWPIKNGLGVITMFFGQNLNPFSGQYYIHKGVDIATYRAGDPVVATADGQIVTLEYEHDFGNYVIIKHKHGYYTRYAHLLSFRVNVGQRVQQGEVIGYVGSTGLSTGPHLHYEVHVGSDVVDPYKYVNIRSTLVRQGR
jgi:murein DD-endopeptidase MepM/ murein hydrolase activator NlpD